MALDSTLWALVVFLGLAAGVAGRTLLPWIYKHAADGSLTWNWKYAGTALSTFAYAAWTVYADGLFDKYVAPATTSYAIAFGAALLYGFLLNHAVNFAVDFGKLSGLLGWLQKHGFTPQPPAPPE